MISLDIVPYATISEAWDYFSTRLDTEDWSFANDDTKLRALKYSTRLINNLKFRGCKFDPLQINEFPREDSQTIPDAIKIATCEIALNLLDGTNMEQEIENLFTSSQSYAAVNTGYISGIVPEYMRAGIPSAIAWGYLRPYLIDPRKLSIRRV
jgi:hypothetical protein